MTRSSICSHALFAAVLTAGAVACGGGEDPDFPPVEEVSPAPADADSTRTDTLRDTITTRTSM